MRLSLGYRDWPLSRTVLLLLPAAGVALALITASQFSPVPETLRPATTSIRPPVLDRHTRPLSVTYQDYWNLSDYRALHEIPEFLQQSFVLAEDKRFYRHQGVDWRARVHALWQSLREGRIVRGASTITEQVIRMRHPRPRTFWSRWLEGWDAQRLEARFSKADILEFYLNQVPSASQRRGAAQAAHYYFDRDLSTLNRHEMLALAVLVRAPSRLDLRQGTSGVRDAVQHLARQVFRAGLMTQEDLNRLMADHLQLRSAQLPVVEPL